MKPLYTFEEVLTLISRSGKERVCLKIVAQVVNQDFYLYTKDELDLIYTLIRIRLSKSKTLEYNS